MNYFEHHIGDYATATSHLSWDEDLAYTRLIRRYYEKEQPIPADLKQACRLVRAVSKAQRDAVATVLEEFFVLRADGWHQDVCDENIARFQEGEPERQAKKANEENRTKKHREERSRLFQALTDAGGHAAWNIGIAELRAMVAALPVTGPDIKPVTPVTAPATPVTATQSPVTNHQTPVLKTIRSSGASTVGGTAPVTADDDPGPSQEPPSPPGEARRAVQVSILLRKLGVRPMTADHPFAVEWGDNAAVSDDLLRNAVDQARLYKPEPEPIHPNYLKPIVAEKLNPAPPKADSSWRFSPQATDAKGRELGMKPQPTESYDAYRDRIQAAINEARRKPSPPPEGAPA